jgi:hypothetical protein
MEEKTKKIVLYSGLGAIALGGIAVYFGGGTEGVATEVVGAVFQIIGVIATIISKLKG